MLEILIVFLGGSIGATLRYLVSLAMHGVGDFYTATLLINVFGSLFLGAVAYIALDKGDDFNKNLRLFLTTGIAGGFTTFSTFNYEIFQLFQANQVMTGFAYMFGSLFLGLFAIILGFAFAKRILTVLPVQEFALQEEDVEDDYVEQELLEDEIEEVNLV